MATGMASVKVEQLLGGRPPLAFGGRIEWLLARVGELPPAPRRLIGGDGGHVRGVVFPGVFQVAEQQPVAEEDRVVSLASGDRIVLYLGLGVCMYYNSGDVIWFCELELQRKRPEITCQTEKRYLVYITCERVERNAEDATA